MLDLLILTLTAFGLGTLTLSLFAHPNLSQWSILVGLFVMPPLFVAIHTLGGLPVQPTSILFFSLSIFGGLLYFRDQIKKGKFFGAHLCSHPLIWAILAFVVGDLALGLRYTITHWDEFSHWMVLPKQMAYFQELYSKIRETDGYLTYLPALPLWQVFTEYLFGKHFDEGRAHVPQFLYSISLLPPLFSILKSTTTKSPIPEPTRLWLLSALSLFILMFASAGRLFIPEALIEPPSYSILAGFILLIFDFNRNKVELRSFWILSSIFLIGSYYLKEHYILLIPALFTFAVLHIIQNDGAGIKKHLIGFVAMSMTFALFYSLWAWYSQPFSPAFDTGAELRQKGGILGAIESRGYLIFSILGKTLQHFTKDTLVHALSFWGLFLLWKRSPRQRNILGFWAPFFVLLLLILSFYYLVNFSDYEATRLASIHRYLSYSSQPLRILGILSLIIYFVIPKSEMFLSSKPRFSIKSAMAVFSFIYLIGFASTYWTRFPNTTYEEVQGIQTLISRNPAGSGLIINQGDNGRLKINLDYYTTTANKDLRKRIHTQYSFSQEKVTEWTTVVTEGEMDELIQNSGFIWVYQSDEFTFKHLSKNLAPDCPTKIDRQLLTKKQDLFFCEPL